MKQLLQISYTLLLAALITACGNTGTKDTSTTDSVTTQPAEHTPAENAVVAGKLPDPVCGMPYDTMYKEWSVYKTDTIHFCSPTCKRVFDKNPEKYAGKLGL
ncbi:YHS domain-containing protein [Chitinophaga rhizophila]|uniref:YHS domain-containing protein n=1 Tax=Chitinophaga rhizophila TaxID=2866212 RepID=A0ABS7GD47_9BACT|nr:YHS domain-containing protein [Chitinophaga rhizophila]MBW8685599.1 YHS domain-containing protein [Chitinophaga rhizophila]